MFVKKEYDPAADLSRKHEIDKDMLPLVDAVNALDAFYTTSSCSGRVVLLEKQTDRKCDARWIYSTHESADFDGIVQALTPVPGSPVWFKQESMILHVCCKDCDSANWLLALAHRAGFKRSGIVAAAGRIMVEITGTERIDTIVAEGGKLLVSEDYVRVLVREANLKMDKNRKRIAMLTGLVNSEEL